MNNPDGTESKIPYEKPVLEILGNLHVSTHGASGGGNDGNGMMTGMGPGMGTGMMM